MLSVQHSQTSFAAGRRRITVDCFLPHTSGRQPALIVLHGSDGKHETMQDPARWLATQGFAVYVPRYFERTGTGDAGPRTMRLLFPVWMRTIWRAVNYVTLQAQADAQRLALVGFSLGAYLALANATLDRRIRAVVDYFGGLPPHFRWLRRPLPPVLILHGEQDRSVPVEEAHKLERYLKASGTPYEMLIYADAGHGFDGAARHDAAHRTVAFLKRHLNGVA